METANFSGATVATFVRAMSQSQYALTVLVKALVELHPDDTAGFVPDDVYPQPDVPTGDPDSGAPLSLKYPSDFAPFKPRADVLLVGTAHRPPGEHHDAFRVGIRVGDLSKQLLVTGERVFDRGILRSSISQPTRATAVPLIYENAFGGPGYGRNPVGKGIQGDSLPLIEYPDQLVKSPYDKPRPAGFGPVSADWEPRRSKTGSYGRDYAQNHWPGFPADFDWSYFNAAPEDQQVEGYLRGDEEVVLENLHSERPLYTTRLPGIRIVCVRNDDDGSSSLVPLQLDTLWIDADAEQCILVWRGQSTIATPECFEIERLGLMAESLANPLKEPESYALQIDAMIKERDNEFDEEPPEADEPDTDSSDASVSPAQGDPAEDKELQAIHTQVAAFRKRHNLPEDDPQSVQKPLQLTPEGKAESERVREEIAQRDQELEAGERGLQWTRERVIRAIAGNESLENADLSGLDLSNCKFAGADFRTATLNRVNFSSSDLANANLCACELEDANFDFAKLDGVLAEGGQFRRASMRKAVLKSAKLAHADLSGASLDQADLTSVDAKAAIFADSSLHRAKISKGQLQSANFSGANLHSAILTDASFADANCIAATFIDANLARSDLAGADFTGAAMERALLEGVQAPGADFSEARLTGASFLDADCTGAWFSSANVDGVNFANAKCVDMQLDGTSAKRASFKGADITSLRGSEHANLTGASFVRAHGLEPLFESCIVDGADFSFADVPGANFIQASAKGTNFTAAELKHARFDYAQCQRAIFARSNLFESCFAGANLDQADARGANLYGSEFLDANFSDLDAHGANLKMTKLQK